MEKYKMILVKWIDSYGSSRWQEIKIEESEDTITSIGHFIGESKKYLVMAMSINNFGNMNETLHIPKQLILEK